MVDTIQILVFMRVTEVKHKKIHIIQITFKIMRALTSAKRDWRIDLVKMLASDS